MPSIAGEVKDPLQAEPSMTWRDVTAECEADEKSGEIRHKGKDIYWDSSYRMTRISGPLTPHVAFIVEKQE